MAKHRTYSRGKVKKMIKEFEDIPCPECNSTNNKIAIGVLKCRNCGVHTPLE